MSRYIDAIKLIKQAYEVAYPIVYDNKSHERGLSLTGIAQLLDEQPTADVVEVVRCKDCKNYQLSKNGYNGLCERQYASFTADDYCSRGERRES